VSISIRQRGAIVQEVRLTMRSRTAALRTACALRGEERLAWPQMHLDGVA
jgi:hypothetical protein